MKHVSHNAARIAHEKTMTTTTTTAANALHDAIMNLPCERTMSHFATKNEYYAHMDGHRDARHAAAELVAVSAATVPAQTGTPVQAQPVARTNKQIVQQTEDLAAALAKFDGYQSSVPYMTSPAPRAICYWKRACIAQEMLTATDPMDAAAELEDESAAPQLVAVPQQQGNAIRPSAEPAGQLDAEVSMIGKLLDDFSELEHLWGLGEPGALVRHRDVFNMLIAAGKAEQTRLAGAAKGGITKDSSADLATNSAPDGGEVA